MKMDCEGAELDILDMTPAKALKKIRNIVFEVHRVKDIDNRLNRITDRLSELGFTIRYYHPILIATNKSII